MVKNITIAVLFSLLLISSAFSSRVYLSPGGSFQWTVPEGINAISIKALDENKNPIFQRRMAVAAGQVFIVKTDE